MHRQYIAESTTESTTRILFVGDVHVKHVNYDDVICLTNLLNNYYDMQKISSEIDFVIFAGDILDSHEKIDAQLMNAAYRLVQSARKIAPTIVIVGNHDYINNKQFLTDNHWMNGMKEWRGVTIVDKPVKFGTDTHAFVACPYVYPGRFSEALISTLGTDWFVGIDCVFAHQEFRGCKMGCIVSDVGDDWDESLPPVISGHIHDRQRVGKNVFYPGSSLVTSFSNSSSSSSGIYEFAFVDGNTIPTETFVQISDVSKRRIVTLQLNDDNLSEKLQNLISTIKSATAITVRIKLVLKGTVHEIQKFKDSLAYKNYRKFFEKISFTLKDDGIDDDENADERNCNELRQTSDARKRKFVDKVCELIDGEKDNDYVKRDYKIIFCDKIL